MPEVKGSLLVIDDEPEIRESLETLLSLEGYAIELATNARAGLERLERKPFDLVLLDVALPDRSGFDLLRDIRAASPALPVVMITAYGSVESAVESMRLGASNYVTKPWDNAKLLAEIATLVSRQRLVEENRELKRTLRQRFSFSQIIGKSEAMQKVFDLVTQVAPTRATVLIQGESGTGKELVAKAIHANSPRADKPFVAVNTGSMPVDLLESQLFGHVKGAFTGAVASKKGLFEIADQGTIFFDEISTIGPETQAKLLRVIQEREFMRFGGTETIKADVRILAASNADLATLVREGRFREDLYHRVNVITIPLPPLRERKEDIPMLCDHFFGKYCEENSKPLRRFSPEAMRVLLDYDWPGNVRELENAVERAVVLSTQETIENDLLPETVRTKEIVKGVRLQLADFIPPLPGEFGARLGADNPTPSLFQIVEECERRIIAEMLEQTRGNQTEAAERFQIPLSTLNQKIKRLNIEVKKKREGNHH